MKINILYICINYEVSSAVFTIYLFVLLFMAPFIIFFVKHQEYGSAYSFRTYDYPRNHFTYSKTVTYVTLNIHGDTVQHEQRFKQR